MLWPTVEDHVHPAERLESGKSVLFESVGLAVVAGLARALGATIQVDFDPGAWTRFTIRVPREWPAGNVPVDIPEGERITVG